jgi:hypothetical protein
MQWHTSHCNRFMFQNKISKNIFFRWKAWCKIAWCKILFEHNDLPYHLPAASAEFWGVHDCCRANKDVQHCKRPSHSSRHIACPTCDLRRPKRERHKHLPSPTAVISRNTAPPAHTTMLSCSRLYRLCFRVWRPGCSPANCTATTASTRPKWVRSTGPSPRGGNFHTGSVRDLQSADHPVVVEGLKYVSHLHKARKTPRHTSLNMPTCDNKRREEWAPQWRHLLACGKQKKQSTSECYKRHQTICSSQAPNWHVSSLPFTIFRPSGLDHPGGFAS